MHLLLSLCLSPSSQCWWIPAETVVLRASTLIIRGLALDEIRFKDIFRVIFKEFRVALLVSLGLALANWTANFYHVQRFEACCRDWSFPNLHCHFIKDHRLYSATVCEKNQFRSCNHGSSAYHNTRGYLLHHHLFYDCHAHLSALEKLGHHNFLRCPFCFFPI